MIKDITHVHVFSRSKERTPKKSTWFPKLISKCSSKGSSAPNLFFHLLSFSPRFLSLTFGTYCTCLQTSLSLSLPWTCHVTLRKMCPGDLFTYPLNHTGILLCCQLSAGFFSGFSLSVLSLIIQPVTICIRTAASHIVWPSFFYQKQCKFTYTWTHYIHSATLRTLTNTH